MSSQKFPPASGVDVKPASDGQSSIIAFRVPDGVVGVGLKNKELSRLVSLLLEASEQVAIYQVAHRPPGSEPHRQTLTVRPILASALGIASGRNGDEMMLNVEVGNLNLTFALNAETVRSTCRDLQSMKDLSKPQRPN